MYDNIDFNDIFILPAKHLCCSDFSKFYPIINDQIYKEKPIDSRNGKVYEFLDFKTVLNNPYQRCTGVLGRDMNIFFLLAEALWIVAGRKDVKFLEFFNSRIKDFSDDGQVFHAPYGWRLQNLGIPSKYNGWNKCYGINQIEKVLKILSKNPADRRAVLQIWDCNLDLNMDSKDIPCNDMVFIKVRDNHLITTIQNRSNDLHWGLPTNIFQFSFLTELMSLCLGVELGTQIHNSQSLHVYDWSEDGKEMWKQYNEKFKFAHGNLPTIYTEFEAQKMDFNFELINVVNADERWSEVTQTVDLLLELLEMNILDREINPHVYDFQANKIKEKSEYLFVVYSLLCIYIDYKLSLKDIAHDEPSSIHAELFNKRRQQMIDYLSVTTIFPNQKLDIIGMAKNFFHTRLKTTDGLLGTL